MEPGQSTHSERIETNGILRVRGHRQSIIIENPDVKAHSNKLLLLISFECSSFYSILELCILTPTFNDWEKSYACDIEC